MVLYQKTALSDNHRNSDKSCTNILIVLFSLRLCIFPYFTSIYISLLIMCTKTACLYLPQTHKTDLKSAFSRQFHLQEEMLILTLFIQWLLLI